jgi:hypothetical protein
MAVQKQVEALTLVVLLLVSCCSSALCQQDMVEDMVDARDRECLRSPLALLPPNA